MGLEIKGSLENNFISVANSNIIGIDVSNDFYKNRDNVIIQNCKGQNGRRFLTQATDKNFGDGMVEQQPIDNVSIEKSKNVYNKINNN